MLTAHPAHISVIGFNHLSRASLLGFPVVPTLNLVTDANGNLVTGDGLYREYNSLNQLLNIRNGSDSSAPLLQQFVYNPIEERVDIKKTFNNSGTVVETVYYWSKSFVTVENLTGQYNFTFVYHEGQLIAQELQGTKLFIHGNHEGSSSVVTNSTGQVVERTEYDAYGNIISGGTKTRFGYENKEADSVVGDTDFNFRKYKSEWGLFTQPDTLIQNVYDPQSLNRYMFERGNPYKNTDPDGHQATNYADFSLIRFGFIGLLVAIGAVTLASVAPLIPSAIEKIREEVKTTLEAYDIAGNIEDAFELGRAIGEYERNPTEENQRKIFELALAMSIDRSISQGVSKTAGGGELGKMSADFIGAQNAILHNSVGSVLASKLSNQGNIASTGSSKGVCGGNMSCSSGGSKKSNGGYKPSNPDRQGEITPGLGICGVNQSCG